MTLRELAHIKRWHVQHRHHHPVEFQAWDVMLTAWLIGFMGALLFFAPGAYVHCRERLHRAGRLRCDWLDALHAATRAERL